MLIYALLSQQFNHEGQGRQGDIISDEIRKSISHSALLVIRNMRVFFLLEKKVVMRAQQVKGAHCLNLNPTLGTPMNVLEEN
jgi:hypothetical protein